MEGLSSVVMRSLHIAYLKHPVIFLNMCVTPTTLTKINFVSALNNHLMLVLVVFKSNSDCVDSLSLPVLSNALKETPLIFTGRQGDKE